ncbi:hypothetical protein OK074_8946 [Actinobacteria bacterium OK074]|nr:hypothetical protein OK074_8946 [Actinobacteria bacterium OK074]
MRAVSSAVVVPVSATLFAKRVVKLFESYGLSYGLSYDYDPDMLTARAG